MSVDKSKICHVWLDFGSVHTGIRFCVEFYPWNRLDVLRCHQCIAHAEHRDTLLERPKLLFNLKPAAGLAVRVVYAARAVARRLHAFLG